MTVAGLTLPFVSAADPDTNAEEGLDPLGLAGLADQLANTIAPEVTARMRRVRFVTAIVACAELLGEPADTLGPDGTPAYLAFEWLVVEALVRRTAARAESLRSRGLSSHGARDGISAECPISTPQRCSASAASTASTSGSPGTSALWTTASGSIRAPRGLGPPRRAA